MSAPQEFTLDEIVVWNEYARAGYTDDDYLRAQARAEARARRLGAAPNLPTVRCLSQAELARVREDIERAGASVRVAYVDDSENEWTAHVPIGGVGPLTGPPARVTA